MEFLNTTHHVGEYWFFLIALIVGFIFLLAIVSACVWSMIADKKINGLLPTIVLVVLTILVGYGVLVQVDRQPSVTHKVLITDFNEVYNQGYEIIGQEGEIYTIQKKTGD